MNLQRKEPVFDPASARTYLFRSQRLGFRSWLPEDEDKMARINADKEVMEFFPSTSTPAQTHEFIERMKKQFAGTGFCYFAVDTLEDHEFIGFIGLSEKDFKASFTPCVDIGWRLDKKQWNKGFATEGAKRCIRFGFDELGLQKIYSFAPEINTRSEQIMKKIGMRKLGNFIHPLLAEHERLKECILYEITR